MLGIYASAHMCSVETGKKSSGLVVSLCVAKQLKIIYSFFEFLFSLRSVYFSKFEKNVNCIIASILYIAVIEDR